MSHGPTSPLLGSAAVLLLALGCATAEEAPEAVSLLGAPLYAPELEADQRAAREADLAAARADYEAQPASEEAAIWYGRRLAYLGRYREAVAVYTQALQTHPTSAALLRHRGHRWITLRRLQPAIFDLRRAHKLTAHVPDQIEPDGQPNEHGIPRTTLRFNILYHLGLAHYLAQDHASALRVYRECMEVALANDDMLVATSHWLYMTLRRLGRDDEANAVLRPIRPDMDILENASYHRLLRFYRGELAPEALLDSSGDDAVEDATVGYGVANWYLCRGDRRRTAELLQRVLLGDSWAAFGYIAAESDVASLGLFLQ